MGENAGSNLLEGLNTRNCNYRIDKCTILQEYVSKKITIRYNNGITEVSDLEEEYNDLCDIMDQLCAYRRTHDCNVKGDREYSET